MSLLLTEEETLNTVTVLSDSVSPCCLGTFCYRINSRLFPTPLDSQESCPVCKKPKYKIPHTAAEPAFIRWDHSSAWCHFSSHWSSNSTKVKSITNQDGVLIPSRYNTCPKEYAFVSVPGSASLALLCCQHTSTKPIGGVALTPPTAWVYHRWVWHVCVS